MNIIKCIVGMHASVIIFIALMLLKNLSVNIPNIFHERAIEQVKAEKRPCLHRVYYIYYTMSCLH